MRNVKNFARFFALKKQMPYFDETLKEEYVSTFTGGRTISLRGMSPIEYNAMCDAIEQKLGGGPFIDELKAQRSAVLKRMTKLGVDTSDWDEVDKFCLNARIAGKTFRQLNIDDLRLLIPRLEAITRKPKKKNTGMLDIPPHVLTAMQQWAADQRPS